MPQYKYTIKENSLSTNGTIIITLEPKTAQDVFNFKPGQYVMLSFYDDAGRFFINHPFSIASSPTQTGFIRLGIKVFGKFTQNLQTLKVGNQVDVLGPFGSFVFDETEQPEVVFIAGGIGITPFISSAYYAADKKLSNKITLLYSTKTLKDTLFYDDIKNLTSVNSNFKVKIKITQEVLTTNLDFCENGYVTKETITENVGDLTGKDFFLCGPGPFMKAMETNLISLGVSSQKIHQEAFNAMQNLSFRKNFKNIFLVYGFSLALFLVTLYFVGFKSVIDLFKEAPEGDYKQSSSINLINSVVNNRRDDLINSKQLLINTVNSKANNTVVTDSPVNSPTPIVNKPKIITPVVNTPVKTTVSAPVINVPVVNTPVVVPTPRTRVS